MDVCLTGTRTFRILCKQSKHCGDNEDVARLVRDYLIVSISQMSDLFWRFVAPKLPTWPAITCKLHASVCWVNSAILADFQIGEEDDMRQKISEWCSEDLLHEHDYMLDRANDFRIQRKTAVSVIIDLHNVTSRWREVRWSVKWESLNESKFWSALLLTNSETRLNMINVINCIRHGFDNRCPYPTGPGDTQTRLEVPTTWQDWDDFFIQQLFGQTRVLSRFYGPSRQMRSTSRE